MYKVILDYWGPKNESVVTESGFRYLDTRSVIKSTKEISDDTEIGILVQFFKLNQSLRYCNGSYYTFQDNTWENKYQEWLKSDEYKKNSFELYYGNGIVD